MNAKQPNLKVATNSAQRALVDLEDDGLMLLVKTGHRDALEVLIKRHQDLVLGFANRYLGDRQLARDVAQDAFLSLWAERQRYQARGLFRAYLFQVVRNRCFIVARQRRSHHRKVDKFSETEPAAQEIQLPVDELMRAERAKQVQQQLQHLPDKVRQVLILRFTHELPLDEISTMTQMPVGTIKSHIFRGLKKMKQLLGEAQ